MHCLHIWSLKQRIMSYFYYCYWKYFFTVTRSLINLKALPLVLKTLQHSIMLLHLHWWIQKTGQGMACHFSIRTGCAPGRLRQSLTIIFYVLCKTSEQPPARPSWREELRLQTSCKCYDVNFKLTRNAGPVTWPSPRLEAAHSVPAV